MRLYPADRFHRSLVHLSIPPIAAIAGAVSIAVGWIDGSGLLAVGLGVAGGMMGVPIAIMVYVAIRMERERRRKLAKRLRRKGRHTGGR